MYYLRLCRSRWQGEYTTPKCHPVNLLKHTGTASLLSDHKKRRRREREGRGWGGGGREGLGRQVKPGGGGGGGEKGLADRLSQTETIIYNLVAFPEHARTAAKHLEQNALCRCGLSGSKVLKVCSGLFRIISPVISGNSLLLHGACQFTGAKICSGALVTAQCMSVYSCKSRKPRQRW